MELPESESELESQLELLLELLLELELEAEVAEGATCAAAGPPLVGSCEKDARPAKHCFH